jgi:hypothetical protein
VEAIRHTLGSAADGERDNIASKLLGWYQKAGLSVRALATAITTRNTATQQATAADDDFHMTLVLLCL